MSNGALVAFGTRGWAATSTIGGKPRNLTDGLPYTRWMGSASMGSFTLTCVNRSGVPTRQKMRYFALDGLNFHNGQIRIQLFSDTAATLSIYNINDDDINVLGYTYLRDLGAEYNVAAVKVTLTGVDRHNPIIHHAIGGYAIIPGENFNWGHSIDVVDESVLDRTYTGYSHVEEKKTFKVHNLEWNYLIKSEAFEFTRALALYGKRIPIYIAAFPASDADMDREYSGFVRMSEPMGPVETRSGYSVYLQAEEVGDTLDERYEDPGLAFDGMLLHALTTDNANQMVPVLVGNAKLKSRQSPLPAFYNNGDRLVGFFEEKFIDGTDVGPDEEIFDTVGDGALVVHPQITNDLFNSRELDWWASAGSGVVVTGRQLGPDGSKNAWKLDDDTATGANALFITVIALSDESSHFILEEHIKKDINETRFPLINLQEQENGYGLSVSINTKTGAYSKTVDEFTPLDTFVRVDAVNTVDSGDWWRVSIGFEYPTTTSGKRLQFRYYPAYSATLGGVVDITLIDSIIVDFPMVYGVDETATPTFSDINKGYPVFVSDVHTEYPDDAFVRDGPGLTSSGLTLPATSYRLIGFSQFFLGCFFFEVELFSVLGEGHELILMEWDVGEDRVTWAAGENKFVQLVYVNPSSGSPVVRLRQIWRRLNGSTNRTRDLISHTLTMTPGTSYGIGLVFSSGDKKHKLATGQMGGTVTWTEDAGERLFWGWRAIGWGSASLHGTSLNTSDPIVISNPAPFKIRNIQAHNLSYADATTEVNTIMA